MITNKKRNANEADMGSVDDDESTTYSYGLFNLPPGCLIVKIDAEGHNNLRNVRTDDRILISNCIETAFKYITESNTQQMTQEAQIIIKTKKETLDEVTLVEYSVLMRFHIDTVISAKHYALIQHVNPLRCGCGDSIQVFCDSTDPDSLKQCLLLRISSMSNPIRASDSVLFHQHFKTMLATDDQDDFSSKNTLNEVSINRKRARKGDIIYNKICDNK